MEQIENELIFVQDIELRFQVNFDKLIFNRKDNYNHMLLVVKALSDYFIEDFRRELSLMNEILKYGVYIKILKKLISSLLFSQKDKELLFIFRHLILIFFKSVLIIHETYFNTYILLGSYILKSQGYLNSENQNEILYTGLYFFELLKNFFKDVFIDLNDKQLVTGEMLGALEEAGENETLKQKINFSLNIHDEVLKNLKKKFDFFEKKMFENFRYKKYMVVRPKFWKLPKNPSYKDKHNNLYFNSNEVNCGGFLLNGLNLQNQIQKNMVDVSLSKEKKYIGEYHNLSVTKNLVNILNNFQSQPLAVNSDLLLKLKKNWSLIPDVMDEVETRASKDLIKLLSKTIKTLLTKKQELEADLVGLKGASKEAREHIEGLLVLNVKDISSAINEKKRIISKVDISRHLNNILSLFLDIKSNYVNAIYFPMKLDFRGRLYPLNYNMHPMSNKLARALCMSSRFEKFDINVFKVGFMGVLQKNINLSEEEILEFFDYVYFEKFKKMSEEDFFKSLKDSNYEEPLLCVAYFLEFKNYLKNKKSTYLSRFLVYNDASASGPQMLSLFFALNHFKEFLNLTTQTKKTKKGDFYVGVIKKFIIEIVLAENEKNVFIDFDEIQENEETSVKVNKKLLSFLKKEKVPEEVNASLNRLLKILRKVSKSSIMTLIYGVTPWKFKNNIIEGLQKEANNISEWVILNSTKQQDIFITKFYKFCRSLEIFQLEELLYYVQAKLEEKGIPLSWEMFNKKITINYREVKKTKIDFKTNFGRKTFVYYKVNENRVGSKNKTSSMANFVHSIDGYVMVESLAVIDNKFVVVPIHDSWGTTTANTYKIQKVVKKIYSELVVDKKILKHVLKYFRDLLVKTATSEAEEALVKQEFDEFISKVVPVGKLKEFDILGSQYLIYPT